MKIAPLGEVKNNFSHYLDVCEREPVFVTRNGRIAAVLEHLSDEDLEDYMLENSPKFRAMIARVATQPGGMTLDEYCAKRCIARSAVRETAGSAVAGNASARTRSKVAAKYKIGKSRRR